MHSRGGMHGGTRRHARGGTHAAARSGTHAARTLPVVPSTVRHVHDMLAAARAQRHTASRTRRHAHGGSHAAARTRHARGGAHAHDGTETRWHARGRTHAVVTLLLAAEQAHSREHTVENAQITPREIWHFAGATASFVTTLAGVLVSSPVLQTNALHPVQGSSNQHMHLQFN